MNLSKYSQTWSGMKAERIIHRLTTPAALVLAIICALGWHKEKETVVLVPPTLSQESRISYNSADEGFKQAWGLFAAKMMGNVTPASASFLLDNLELVFSPQTYQSSRQAVAEQVDRVISESLSISFLPKNVMFENETDRVYVTGKSLITGASGDSVNSTRTYEFEIEVAQGRPEVSYFDLYEGSPRTAKVRERERRDEERARERAAKK